MDICNIGVMCMPEYNKKSGLDICDFLNQLE